MINVTMFRQQHDELLDIASEISSHLTSEGLAKNSGQVQKLFVRLLGKLSVHLSLEDEWLYPKLLEHSDETVRRTAERFVAEMGGIGQAVTKFKDKWIISTSAIGDDPQGFINEAKRIFTALGQRIEAENKELYRIAE